MQAETHAGTGEPKDLLGKAMTAGERALLEGYRRIESLLARDDLPPCAAANVREAVASLWQAVNDLVLVEDRPAI